MSRLAGEVALQSYSPEQVEQWQREIYQQTLSLSRTMDGPNFTRIARDDLVRMIRLYDERFFGGKILPTSSKPVLFRSGGDNVVVTRPGRLSRWP